MDLSLFQKPQINLARSTPWRMWLVSLAAMMAIFQSSLSDGFHSLIIALAASAGALGTELLFNLRQRYYSIKDGSALASALVLTLLLPNGINPLCAFLGAVFAMAVLKHSFGGLGSNWINPAAGAWLFIRSAWPGAAGRGIQGSPLVNLAASLEGGLRNSQGPLALLKINGWESAPLDRLLSSFLNGTVFRFTGAALPQGYLGLLAPPGPGIIADRGLLFLLGGTILLASFQCFRLWLPGVFLLCYSLLVRAFGALSFGGAPGEGDVLFALLSGGTAAAAFMLITDPATGPKSVPGRGIFAALSALFAFLFRYPGMDPYGAVSAVLVGNALAPLVRRIENGFYYEKRREPWAKP
ncbi:MAG: RnfABCDGE type electron transport complex subunit D [Treponema sp.]|jgi:electron transport complex protein RnfD|nr:RnfABCDGE type electron transport complex subunit D [Treponema sp.]